MTLRGRFTSGSAAVVALTVVLVGVAVYATVAHVLGEQVDRSLRDRPAQLARQAGVGNFSTKLGDCHVLQLRGDVNLDRGGFLTLVDRDGNDCSTPQGAPALPRSVRGSATTLARDVHASGTSAATLSTVSVRGHRYRVATARLHRGLAAQVARPLDEVDRFLQQLRLILLGIALVAIVFAFELGSLVSRYVVAPVTRLTEVVESISSSRSLAAHVPVDGTGDTDEISRLAVRFNDMIDSLANAREAHEQLISDASHELRTPLTSIRANVEVLSMSDAMPTPDREELVGDIVRQFEELTSTVNNVIDLARAGQPLDADAEPVRLDEVATRAVERARLHSPTITIDLDAEPCAVLGSPARLQTALNNLVDNACKHGGTGGQVEVTVTAGGEVRVRDHGDGFREEDLPHVFDRYYRSSASRAIAGSGLGLAIVQQVAETHGGSATARNATVGTGAELVLHLPPVVAGAPT